jgi:integrating conjugative element protein (TIGR03752 family)
VRTAFSPQTPGQNQNPAVVSNPGGVYGPNPGAASATVLDANGQPIPNELQPAPLAAEAAKPTLKPYFTIPENSTLIGSTAMTALVGRVPVNGKVTDAMPFKVLIGRTNLAANGLDVPDDVSGMVVSGIAVGDWGLSCTQGYVQSVTFLFNDGSIKTVSQRTGGAFTTNVGNAAATGGGLASTQKIGWISDKRGVPCITGKRISNAPSYLSTTVGLKALEVGAKAAALSQTTTTANPLGGASSAVTGNSTDFILGSTVAGGVNEISDWIKQRLNNSFDAVYVEPGFEVAVHIDQELQLDKAPEARRLDYGRVNAQKRSGNGNARLD